MYESRSVEASGAVLVVAARVLCCGKAMVACCAVLLSLCRAVWAWGIHGVRCCSCVDHDHPLHHHHKKKEQNCIAMCMDRYIETMNAVQHTLSERSATR